MKTVYEGAALAARSPAAISAWPRTSIFAVPQRSASTPAKRHGDGTQVVGGEERACLRERETEVRLDQRRDRGDPQWPDVGDGLRQHDERKDHPAPGRRV